MGGFSLIELLVTMSILAILLGIGLVNLSLTSRSLNLNTERERVKRQITLVRAEAERRRVGAIVKFAGNAINWEFVDGSGIGSLSLAAGVSLGPITPGPEVTISGLGLLTNLGAAPVLSIPLILFSETRTITINHNGYING